MFLHCGSKKFVDFDEIRKEIERETDRAIGTTNGVSKEPINLRIFSPNMLNLTLVDLPGLTKVAVDGQPAEIVKQIRDMNLDIIREENCLILAVTPADISFANSDALELAKIVDPKGVRTIGVMTKLDKMDKGTNACEILKNKKSPLQHGYLGVVNRSPMDIDGKKDIKEALISEKKFFMDRSCYSDVIDRLGIPNLQTFLSKLLTEHIRNTLKELRIDLRGKMYSVQEEIEKFKDSYPTDTVSKKKLVLEQVLIDDFQSNVNNTNRFQFVILQGVS